MTLSVTAYRVTADEEWIELDTGRPDLAGFESTRQTFYAGPEARRLGLILFPQMAETDLNVWGNDLPQLKAEVLAMMALFQAEDPEPDEGAAEPYWQFRLDNILAAIEAASKYGPEGLVVIQ